VDRSPSKGVIVSEEKMETHQSQLEALQRQLEDLQARLREPEDIIRAIREGEVDAFVVNDPNGEQVYRLRNVDVLYRGMIEQMRQGAVALDDDGLVLYSNAYFAELVGADRERMVGTSFFAFVPEESRPHFVGGELAGPQADLLLRATNGSLVPVQVCDTRIVLEGSPVHCLIVTDLSEEQRREQLVIESRRKDEFLAMLAHELRNPIAPIRNAIQVLELAVEPDPARVRWARQLIARQIQQLGRLVDDLMDISRISRGRLEVELRPLDLRSVVQRAVETTESLIEERGHRLNVDLPTRRIPIDGDAVRLSQVVSNVLHNAAKFTPDGGDISIRLDRDGVNARITVRDGGIGIGADVLPRIFELFTQGDATLERKQGGLGIGLALVRNVVEMHGGRVHANSEGLGKGSEFVVELPLLDEQSDEASADVPVPARSEHPKRIMVVDDNVDVAESLAMLLQMLGHDVRTVNEGASVVAAAEAFRPDVMFLDIGLPDVNGYELAAALRKVPGLRALQLVALTGYGQEEYRKRSRDAGFDHHWVKPLDLRKLESLIGERILD
jgi:PAS domain S-box-containing protein